MKIQEIRDMSQEDIKKKKNNIKEELFNLKFRAATSKIENPMRLKFLRRDIAKIETIIKENSLKEINRS